MKPRKAAAPELRQNGTFRSRRDYKSIGCSSLAPTGLRAGLTREAVDNGAERDLTADLRE